MDEKSRFRTVVASELVNSRLPHYAPFKDLPEDVVKLAARFAYDCTVQALHNDEQFDHWYREAMNAKRELAALRGRPDSQPDAAADAPAAAPSLFKPKM